MHALALLLIAAVVITGVSAAAVWWMEPSRRMGRLLAKILGGPLDALAASPARGQAVGVRFDAQRLAIIRNLADGGLVFELHELVGAELIFDGQVAARAFRGESRKPLDRIDPQVGEVILRVVFDDVRDPEFETVLWSQHDPHRPGWDGPAAVRTARRFFARVEALVRK